MSVVLPWSRAEHQLTPTQDAPRSRRRPTSSGLVDEALRQRKKIQREKSLWNPLADSVGSTASYISPQIRLLSSLRGVKSGREDATSLSQIGRAHV